MLWNCCFHIKQLEKLFKVKLTMFPITTFPVLRFLLTSYPYLFAEFQTQSPVPVKPFSCFDYQCVRVIFGFCLPSGYDILLEPASNVVLHLLNPKSCLINVVCFQEKLLKYQQDVSKCFMSQTSCC